MNVFLCATSVSSVPLWLNSVRNSYYRGTEDTELAQRIETSGTTKGKEL
jgi:hypothetical protein